MAEPVLLPVEIWCQIFQYMDEASIRNASAACRLFFEIVRGSEKYSGHVILKQIDLSQLVVKIKSEEWTWQRWPYLKTLEIPIQLQHPAPTYTIGHALDPFKFLKLEQCPSLDKILIFNCSFKLFYEDTFIVRGLCLNPSTTPSNFSTVSLPNNVSYENVTCLEIIQLKGRNSNQLAKIGKLANQINRLSIDLESHIFSSGLLTHEFTTMLVELKTSLTTFDFTILNYSTSGANVLLKALIENCLNLKNLCIKDCFVSGTREVYFLEYSFPKLKELTVPKLQHISAFINDAKDLTNLKVENVTALEFTSFDFSSMSMKLKRLQKCEIFVITNICQDRHDWAKIVDQNFQPWTKVVIYQLSGWQSNQTEAVFIKPFYEKTKVVIEFGPWRQRTWNSSLDPALEYIPFSILCQVC